MVMGIGRSELSLGEGRWSRVVGEGECSSVRRVISVAQCCQPHAGCRDRGRSPRPCTEHHLALCAQESCPPTNTIQGSTTPFTPTSWSRTGQI